LLVLQVARNAAHKVRPGGTLLFMGGTGGRRPGIGLVIASTVTAALPALTANLALELAPVRVNLIAAGFVDTPLSASLLGDELENRRNQLRATLPIRRVVGPAGHAAVWHSRGSRIEPRTAERSVERPRPSRRQFVRLGKFIELDRTHLDQLVHHDGGCLPKVSHG
jgi:NAD(P)-dependent dehydrogenase (short-subunit alcohol dehydrogenase family)